MTIPIVQADLVARIGEYEVDRYAKAAGDASVADRIEEAWDVFRSAALNTFTEATIDALTSATIPPEIRKHVVSLAIGGLVAGSNHPDYIDAATAAAQEWLKFLAAGKVHYSSDVLTRITTSSGGMRARVGAPDSRVFDAADTTSTGGLRRRVTLI